MKISSFLSNYVTQIDCEKFLVPFNCKICGRESNEGLNWKKVFSSNFTDFNYLRSEDNNVCKECSSALKDRNLAGKNLRATSFLINAEEMQIIKNDTILNFIKNPIKTPFYFIYTFSQKKHIFFKSSINYSTDEFIISTDNGNINIKKEAFLKLYGVCKELYEAGFSKTDIQTGSYNKNAAIKNLGLERLLKLESQIVDSRGSMQFDFLIKILRKDERCQKK